MALVSVTRLRLRSPFTLPVFFWYTIRSLIQAKHTDGCLAATVRQYNRAFWTLTAWRDEAAMRAFMAASPHLRVMPRLKHWCDEASLAHWVREDFSLPTWTEAEHRLGIEGRTSRVLHPSPAQAAGKTLGETARSNGS